MAESDKKYLGQEPSDKEVRTVLDQIKAMRRETVAPADTASLDQAEAEARQLYKDRASRAEWMSVAERVGNALVKLGAAGQAQRAGVDVSRVQDVAPTDWEGRIGRYGREMDSDISGLRDQRRSLQDTVKASQGLADQSYEDQVKGLGDQLGFEKEQYRQKYDTYQAGLRDQAASEREAARLASGEAREASRQEKADARADSRVDTQLRTAQIQDLRSQLADAQKSREAAVAAANVLSSQADLSPKSVTKLEQQLPGLLGRAGITPEQLAEIDKQATTPGRFWGENVDEDKRKSLIQEKVVGEADKRITTLRQALDKVLGGGQAPAAPAGQVPAGQGKLLSPVQLKEYADKNFSGNLEAARKFLADQGYTVQ